MVDEKLLGVPGDTVVLALEFDASAFLVEGLGDGLEDDLQTCNDQKKRQSDERNYRNS